MGNAKQYIYSFEEAASLGPDKLGGKGASLAQMQSWGVTVPPGFIIITDAGKALSKSTFQETESFRAELGRQLSVLEKKIQQTTGLPVGFGDAKYPLLVSVRSGAPVSMPGQMSTLLNVGLTEKSLDNIYYDSRLTAELYWRLYRTLIVALGIDRARIQTFEDKYLSNSGVSSPSNLPSDILKKLSDDFRVELSNMQGKKFADEFEKPETQLWLAIKAVWDSWLTPSLQSYRESLGVAEDTWTAVVVQTMVFGNKNQNSGSGVVYSRNLLTGKQEDPLSGSFLFNAQGEDVVSGEAKGEENLNGLKQKSPKLYSLLSRNVRLLEKKYKNPLDIEFTIEDGRLWFLQARTAPLSDRGTIQFVVDLVEAQDWKISEREAAERIRPSLMERLYLPVFSGEDKNKALQSGKLLARGIPASPGVGVGKIAVTPEKAQEYSRNGQPFIWVRDALDPKEHQIMRKSVGVISVKSSVGSHGAIMANVLKRPCVVCCDGLQEVNEKERFIVIAGKKIQEDSATVISVDAITGEIFDGSLSTMKAETFPALMKFEQWWNKYDGTKENSGSITPDEGRSHSSWGNATALSKYKLVDKYRQEVRQYLLDKYWNTEKAQVVEAMSVIPDEMRIKQLVVDATDKKALSKAMYDVVKKKDAQGNPLFWNGPRTALGPGAEGAAPWQMGMNKEEQIEAFLTQRDFKGVEKAKSGGYPRWMSPDPSDPWQTSPVQIIVMYDPAEKGVEQFEPEHFVCNVSCRSNPDEVMVDINLGTAQLRSFEKISPDNLIRLKMELNPVIPDLRGRRVSNFGRNYWNLEKIKAFPEFRNLGESELITAIEEKMNNNDFSEPILKALIGERTFRVAQYVEKQVFGEWWSKYDLPYRMRALDEVFSLQVLEIQGRADIQGNVKWFLVYDAKGRDEKKTISDAK